ncbi:MAG: glycine betaine ABC transporter substrate-binding protein [Cyanobacteria bacterium P01_A01_bin.105]
MFNRRTILGLALLAATTTLAACSGGGSTDGGVKIRIGSKEFTEQYLLAHMFEMVLDNAGYDANYTAIGGTSENHAALLAGEIDMYPEYTGTALLVHLEKTYDANMSNMDVYDTVKDAYAEQFNVTLLQPGSFNNTYAFVMMKDRANELGVTSITDVAGQASDLVFATDLEFADRSDGLPAMKEVYGGLDFADVKSLDPGLLYSGLENGDVDVTTGYGTDGQIVAMDLLVLDDDKSFWPPYAIAPFVRQDTLDANPEIADILNGVTAVLDDETMGALNWEVAGNGKEPDEVARQFLEEQGLL